jgi:hypothetical protein
MEERTMSYLRTYIRNPVAWMFVICLVAYAFLFGTGVSFVFLIAALVLGALLLDDYFAFVSKHSKQGGHNDRPVE